MSYPLCHGLISSRHLQREDRGDWAVLFFLNLSQRSS